MVMMNSFDSSTTPIKEEIELPDLNLDENGEVQSFEVKTEPFEGDEEEQVQGESSFVNLEIQNFPLSPSEVPLIKEEQNIVIEAEEPFSPEVNLENDFPSTSGTQDVDSPKRKRRPPNRRKENLQENAKNPDLEQGKCTECQKSFTSKRDLSRHLLIHSGEKPFKCNECEKSFTRKDHLKIHSRVHSGKKPYKCDKCEKTFSQQCYLKIHFRIHSGEKPYKCNECPRTFARKHHLGYHMPSHFEEKLSKRIE